MAEVEGEICDVVEEEDTAFALNPIKPGVLVFFTKSSDKVHHLVLTVNVASASVSENTGTRYNY